MEYNKRHGGPYDRGAADYYYWRPRDPHYYVGPTKNSRRVEASEMTTDELEAYHAGYDEETMLKDWGR